MHFQFPLNIIRILLFSIIVLVSAFCYMHELCNYRSAIISSIFHTEATDDDEVILIFEFQRNNYYCFKNMLLIKNKTKCESKTICLSLLQCLVNGYKYLPIGRSGKLNESPNLLR